MFFLLLLAATASLLQGVTCGSLREHNASFVPEYILRVTYQPASVACRTKSIVLVNNTSPGPQLVLEEDRTTWIRVYNDMPNDNLTMHWHGLTQSTAPFSDGTPVASQWPITPGHFFDYEVHPDRGQAGTYFYHSHVEFQAVSAAGPLIVEEAEGTDPPYAYDEERMLFLSELYNKTDHDIVEGLTAVDFSWSGETETILVNGESYPALDASESLTTPQSAWSKPMTNAHQICGPAIFDVDPGKTYRFRTVGGLALNLVSYQFEDHNNLTIIAADGRYTQPAETDHIQIGPGQRFDYLLTTKSASELNQLRKTWFWIQLETAGSRPTDVVSYAILRYNHDLRGPAPFSVPKSQPAGKLMANTTNVSDWLEYTLRPLKPNGFPANSEVTRRVYLSNVELKQNTQLWWGINNRTWTEVDMHLNATPYNSPFVSMGTPYLVDVYQRGEAAMPNYDLAVDQYGGWDPNLNVYVAKPGEVIDIIILNVPDGTSTGYDIHPWHIHGGHIYDIGSGSGNYSIEENYRKLGDWIPAKRDTTYLYKYTDDNGIAGQPNGWRAWRLKVEYAGVWMVHCHILQHMIMGMQTVWTLGNASEIMSIPQPYVAGYLQYGGSAYGNATYDPLVYHHFD